MNRLCFAFAASLTLAACGAKQNGSVCNSVPPPEACMTECDPTPGAANSCPSGFHCSADGKCDAQCTQGGDECGDGYVCTADGSCENDMGPGSNGPDASCPAINFTPMPVTPSIQLVLDQSGSMYTNNLGNVTRFQAMRDALVGTMGVVTGLESKAYFGSKLYTCNGTAEKFTDVGRALNNAAAIRTSIDGLLNVEGQNTPTAAALDKARTDFMASPAPAGSPPVIVLATDGEPNSCNGNMSQSQYNAESVAAAGAAFSAGYPVYVLAISTGNNTHFQDLANAGQGWVSGQPNVKYYPVNNAADLQAAFQTIINGVISCDLHLTSSIDDGSASQGIVTVNGMMLTYGIDWTLVNGNIVRLTGGACDMLKASMNPVVQATFPCGSVIF